MEILIFIVLPALGLVWFLNLLTFLENLHKGKSMHNQKVLGGFWTVVFICSFMVALTAY